MTKHRDQDYTLYPISGGGVDFKTKKGEQDGRAYRETDGLVATPYGYVRVWSTYFQGACRVSNLYMIKEGREYSRRFEKEFTRRGLVTKAKQFAKELHGEPVL